ncbi:MAG: aminopeptidase N [Bacteriovoracaceae bacterium]|nr:aminopeptidase N [Bacteriovoracaceae bacterium]
MKQLQTIYLRDYKAPNFTVEHIDLTLDIFDGYTDVTSKLEIIRSKSAPSGALELELLGEGMELQKISRDGKELTSSAYSLSSDRLNLHAISESILNLEIKNRIYPEKNSALEGFYKSGDILCTQCEPEGFRKITYFIDRPDAMAKFKTTLKADKKRYPMLLSNGNRVDSGELPGGRHFVSWVDPFKKPSYLFAAVAGDLEMKADSYTTKSGRKVALEVYVDKGQGSKTKHAIESLAHAMKWDEETFGLEYDLDIYMIVAVESFNFGAMENKGLNIFNSAYVLADPTTATDGDFQNIEGVVGHEYFHNWTGNRVTCRDWFQLTLKEGLTVFRDQEFSSDMLSRAVKRIEDVKRLKEAQFSEDAGPMSHPIRPTSYIEINNFYTATVYEKGAEVIRMIHTLIGDKNFKRGITEYFKRHDGQAVTTEDFVSAMEFAGERDLTQFKNWYSRPGTPTLVVRGTYDESAKTYTVNVKQKYASVMNERLENNVLLIPFKMALFAQDGKMIGNESLVEVTKLEQEFVINNVTSKPIPSWNRSFSAPVHVDYPYTEEELLHLVAFDTDAVSRYEALQRVYINTIKSWIKSTPPSELPSAFAKSLSLMIKDESIDPAFKAYLFEVPSESQIHQDLDVAQIESVNAALKQLQHLIGKTFSADWMRIYQNHLDPRVGDVSAKAMGSRALKNRALMMLVKGQHADAAKTLHSHFYQAKTMSEESVGLALYCQMSGADSQEAITHFYKKWKHEPLVMLRWFGSQAAYTNSNEVLERLVKLESDPVFRNQVPNDLRGLYQNFAKGNLMSFHAQDGSGYEFLSERIARIDKFNPQVASRLTGAFGLMPKMDEGRKSKMKGALKKLVEGGASKDVYEVASRYLGQS